MHLLSCMGPWWQVYDEFSADLSASKSQLVQGLPIFCGKSDLLLSCHYRQPLACLTRDPIPLSDSVLKNGPRLPSIPYGFRCS